MPPVLSVSGGDEALEGGTGDTGTLGFWVSLDKAAESTVTATITISGGAVGPSTISIPAGETGVPLEVTFEGDDVFEGDETVTVTLSDISGADAGTVAAAGTILNDDIIPSALSLTGPAEIVEGDSGENTVVTYRAELDRPTTVDVLATATINGVEGPVVTIAAGQTVAFFDVTLEGDNDQETGETLQVSLEDITNATAGTTYFETAVIDNDTPVLSLVSTGDVFEGSADEMGQLMFVARLDKATNIDVTAQVNVVGNAIGPQSVTIAAGTTELSFPLLFDGDDIDEADETISVTLSNIENADAGTLAASATIFDDDEPAVPDNVLIIDNLSGFGGFQDRGQAEVSDDGTAITLLGNAWKATLEDITVTADTVMTFELNVEDAGEILGIAFETDNVLSATRSFQFAGSQTWAAHQDYRYDEAAGGTQTITVNVGQHFTGTFDRLVFIGDDDGNASTRATFSNVRIEVPFQDPRSFSIEAEDHIASGYVVEDRGNSQTNGELASLLGGGSNGVIAYEFEGMAGHYELDVFVFDETDGQSTIEVLVNGNTVSNFVLDQSLGSAITSETNLVALETGSILLEEGDVVEIRGTQNLAEYARIDRIEFNHVSEVDEFAF